MARIHTTIWDLAAAISEEAEAVAESPEEAERLSMLALIGALHEAVLADSATRRPLASARRMAPQPLAAAS